jgi:predicted nuclease of predicted toxin-antitoxin system
MKILIDMNLSPTWVAFFALNGWEAIHWSAVGDPQATDRVIMQWARSNDAIVFTHDLDFGTILAVTQASGPSVLQVRANDVLPRFGSSLENSQTGRCSRSMNAHLACESCRSCVDRVVHPLSRRTLTTPRRSAIVMAMA